MTTSQKPGQSQADVQVRRAMSRLRGMLQYIRDEQVRARERLGRSRTGARGRRDRVA